MSAKDMTSSQIKQTNSQRILKYLQENNGEISNEEISRETRINKTNIPREIKKLESQGYKISKRYEQIGRSKFVWFLLTISQDKQTISQNKTKKRPVIKIKKIEGSEPINKALSISQKREHLNPKFIEAMGQELRLFGTTIPIDKKQEIVNWVFKNVQHLYDGVYNYQRIWKTRYKNYLVNMPDSPVIEKYQSMSAALEFIKKIKILKEELENAKNGKS